MPREPGAGTTSHSTPSVALSNGGAASSPWRRADVAALASAGPADLLVVGGGIVGAGVAREAAMRGLRVVLVERGDLAGGTSSRSSRLIHGGLRYLERGELRLVAEALHERSVLRRIAPHLVRPLPFVFPIHAGDRLSPWRLRAGLLLYDLLAVFRNVEHHRGLSKRALLELEPLLRDRGLKGGARYWDAQCDDARLTLATARSAQSHGAAVATYTAVTELAIEHGRVVGAAVEDRLTGATATLRARAVVNATGPWADGLRRLEDPTAPRLLRPTKGVHVVVPRARVGHREAIAFQSPIDGRVMFILPWGEQSYIGTTDTDVADPPDEVRADDADIVYLLRSANALFPGARLTADDVQATWAGLRPLLADGAGAPASERSREHVVAEGRGGMLTVAGGKLTTYRAMAADVVDQLARRLGAPAAGGVWRARSGSDREPLPGGDAHDFESIRALGRDAGLPGTTIEHLIAHYGTEAAGLFNLARSDRALAEPLDPAHPAIAAEVVHAARRELAQRLEDVLVRRIHLYYELPDRGCRAAAVTATLLGRELGWDAARVERERQGYEEMAGRRGGE